MDREHYLSEFGEILLFIIVAIVFAIVALFVSKVIRPNRPNAQKLSTYESGEEPQGLAWVQFNLRFYVIALIFLLFEAEIIFLFPWATVFARKELMDQTNGAWGWFALGEMVIFIIILALGLAYAWANGHLDWVKPEPQSTTFTSPVPRSFYDNINQKFSNHSKTRKQ